MSEDRYLLIKNATSKWDTIQELVEDYRECLQRMVLITNLGDDVVGLHLEFEQETIYERFIQYIYTKRGSIYYPEKLEWLPVSEEEWMEGEIPTRETPIFKEGNIVDQYGLTWYPERVEKYRKKYKAFRIRNFSKYRESLDGKDLYVTTEDGIEEVDPIIVKFPYYANK